MTQSVIPSSADLQVGTVTIVANRLSGAGTVTGVGRCLRIIVTAYPADSTFNVAGLATLEARASVPVVLDLLGNITAPAVTWVSGAFDVEIIGVT